MLKLVALFAGMYLCIPQNPEEASSQITKVADMIAHGSNNTSIKFKVIEDEGTCILSELVHAFEKQWKLIYPIQSHCVTHIPDIKIINDTEKLSFLLQNPNGSPDYRIPIESKIRFDFGGYAALVLPLSTNNPEPLTLCGDFDAMPPDIFGRHQNLQEFINNQINLSGCSDFSNLFMSGPEALEIYDALAKYVTKVIYVGCTFEKTIEDKWHLTHKYDDVLDCIMSKIHNSFACLIFNLSLIAYALDDLSSWRDPISSLMDDFSNRMDALSSWKNRS